MFTIALLWVMSYVGLTFSIGVRFVKQQSVPSWQLKVLRSTALLTSSALFVPLFGLLLKALQCGALGFSDTECWIGGHLAVCLLVLTVVPAFIALSLLISSVFLDRSPLSRDLGAQVFGRPEATMLLGKVILVALFTLAPGAPPAIMIIALLSVACAWVAMYPMYQPYCTAWVNDLRAAFGGAFFWITLCYILVVFWPAAGDVGVLAFAGAPVAAAGGALLSSARRNLLASRAMASLRTVAGFDVWARSRLRLRYELLKEERGGMDADFESSSRDLSPLVHEAIMAHRRKARAQELGDSPAAGPGSSRLPAIFTAPADYLLAQAACAYDSMLQAAPRSGLAHIIVARFYQAVRSNRYAEMKALATARSISLALDTRFFVYQRLRQLRELGDQDSALLQLRGSLSTIDRVLYDSHKSSAARSEAALYTHLVALWDELATRQPDLGELQATALGLRKALIESEQHFRAQLALDPENPEPHRVYAIFLANVLGSAEGASHHWQRARRAAAGARSKSKASVQSFRMFATASRIDSAEEGVGTLEAWGDEQALLEVYRTNAAMRRMVFGAAATAEAELIESADGDVKGGAARSLVGRSITALLPPAIAPAILAWMRAYIIGAQPVLVRTTVMTLLRSHAGIVMPARWYLTETPPKPGHISPGFALTVHAMPIAEGIVLAQEYTSAEVAGHGAAWDASSAGGSRNGKAKALESKLRVVGLCARTASSTGLDPQEIENEGVPLGSLFPTLGARLEGAIAREADSAMETTAHRSGAVEVRSITSGQASLASDGVGKRHRRARTSSTAAGDWLAEFALPDTDVATGVASYTVNKSSMKLGKQKSGDSAEVPAFLACADGVQQAVGVRAQRLVLPGQPCPVWVFMWSISSTEAGLNSAARRGDAAELGEQEGAAPGHKHVPTLEPVVEESGDSIGSARSGYSSMLGMSKRSLGRQKLAMSGRRLTSGASFTSTGGGPPTTAMGESGQLHTRGALQSGSGLLPPSSSFIPEHAAVLEEGSDEEEGHQGRDSSEEHSDSDGQGMTRSRRSSSLVRRMAAADEQWQAQARQAAMAAAAAARDRAGLALQAGPSASQGSILSPDVEPGLFSSGSRPAPYVVMLDDTETTPQSGEATLSLVAAEDTEHSQGAHRGSASARSAAGNSQSMSGLSAPASCSAAGAHGAHSGGQPDSSASATGLHATAHGIVRQSTFDAPGHPGLGVDSPTPAGPSDHSSQQHTGRSSGSSHQLALVPSRGRDSELSRPSLPSTYLHGSGQAGLLGDSHLELYVSQSSVMGKQDSAQSSLRRSSFLGNSKQLSRSKFRTTRRSSAVTGVAGSQQAKVTQFQRALRRTLQAQAARHVPTILIMRRLAIAAVWLVALMCLYLISNFRPSRSTLSHRFYSVLLAGSSIMSQSISIKRYAAALYSNTAEITTPNFTASPILTAGTDFLSTEAHRMQARSEAILTSYADMLDSCLVNIQSLGDPYFAWFQHNDQAVDVFGQPAFHARRVQVAQWVAAEMHLVTAAAAKMAAALNPARLLLASGAATARQLHTQPTHGSLSAAQVAAIYSAGYNLTDSELWPLPPSTVGALAGLPLTAALSWNVTLDMIAAVAADSQRLTNLDGGFARLILIMVPPLLLTSVAAVWSAVRVVRLRRAVLQLFLIIPESVVQAMRAWARQKRAQRNVYMGVVEGTVDAAAALETLREGAVRRRLDELDAPSMLRVEAETWLSRLRTTDAGTHMTALAATSMAKFTRDAAASAHVVPSAARARAGNNNNSPGFAASPDGPLEPGFPQQRRGSGTILEPVAVAAAGAQASPGMPAVPAASSQGSSPGLGLLGLPHVPRRPKPSLARPMLDAGSPPLTGASNPHRAGGRGSFTEGMPSSAMQPVGGAGFVTGQGSEVPPAPGVPVLQQSASGSSSKPKSTSKQGRPSSLSPSESAALLAQGAVPKHQRRSSAGARPSGRGQDSHRRSSAGARAGRNQAAMGASALAAAAGKAPVGAQSAWLQDAARAARRRSSLPLMQSIEVPDLRTFSDGSSSVLKVAIKLMWPVLAFTIMLVTLLWFLLSEASTQHLMIARIRQVGELRAHVELASLHSEVLLVSVGVLSPGAEVLSPDSQPWTLRNLSFQATSAGLRQHLERIEALSTALLHGTAASNGEQLKHLVSGDVAELSKLPDLPSTVLTYATSLYELPPLARDDSLYAPLQVDGCPYVLDLSTITMQECYAFGNGLVGQGLLTTLARYRQLGYRLAANAAMVMQAGGSATGALAQQLRDDGSMILHLTHPYLDAGLHRMLMTTESEAQASIASGTSTLVALVVVDVLCIVCLIVFFQLPALNALANELLAARAALIALPGAVVAGMPSVQREIMEAAVAVGVGEAIAMDNSMLDDAKG